MIKKRILAIITLLIISLSAFALASCGGGADGKITERKELPATVTCGQEIYFRDYIKFNYGADYKLSVSYTDKIENEEYKDKELDSLVYKFDTVSKYEFKLKSSSDTKTYEIDCKPEIPVIKDTHIHDVRTENHVFLDQSFLNENCDVALKNPDAQNKDIDFKWEFVEVEIESTLVDGQSRVESLEGVTEYTFSEKSIYNFKIKATNSAGSDEAILVCSNVNMTKHSNDVTGYIMTGSSTIEFAVPGLTGVENGTVVKTRLSDKDKKQNYKFDATFDSEKEKFVINNPDKDFVSGTNYRIYATGPDGESYSTFVVVPDLFITKENIKELELVKKGYVVLTEDIDMSDIKDWGKAREPLFYKDYLFMGTFDGLGHVISNFTTNGRSYLGGLIWSAEGAVIKNLIVDNANVVGSNSVVVGRCGNKSEFINVAVKANKLSMKNSGLIAGPTEEDIKYTDCLMYLSGEYNGDIVGSGFFGGFYSRFVKVNNVYAVTSTKLPDAPLHYEIETIIRGNGYNRFTEEEALGNFDKKDFGTKLLNKAGKLFFTVPEPTHITKANIRDLELVTDGNYVLDEDIDMNGITDWGKSRVFDYHDYVFTGKFDGQGHVISNFTTGNKAYCGGLFWSTENAVIKNLIFDNAKIEGSNGLVTGRTGKYTKFENVAVRANKSTMYNAGIIAGPSEEGIIYENCLMYLAGSYTGKITSSSFFGGLYARSVKLNNVYLVTSTELPDTPKHITSDPDKEIVTKVTGTYEKVTEENAKKDYANKEFNNEILNKASKLYFAEKPPVMINNENFDTLINATNGKFALAEDIDLTGKTWESTADFRGTLDGNGHAIKNMTTKTGVFKILNGATIKNLVLVDVHLTNITGSLSNRINSGKNFIENVVVKIATEGGTRTTGLVGYHVGGELTAKNVFIEYPVIYSNLGYKGFISSYMGGVQNIDGVYCVGNTDMSIHSSQELSNSLPTYTTNNYEIKSNIIDITLTDLYKNSGSDFLKEKINAIYSTELSQLKHITNANIRDLELATTGFFILDEDIDMSGINNWGSARAGKNFNQYFFSGILEGNGHTIKNFNVSGASHSGGLFYGINGATIRNIRFSNATISSNNNGLLCGRSGNTSGGNTLKVSKLENIAVDLNLKVNYGVGLLCAQSDATIMNDVLVYAKSMSSEFTKSSVTTGVYQVESPVINNFYCITDNSVISVYIKAPEKDTAKVMTSAEAKSYDTSSMTKLLKSAMNDWFSVKNA